MRIVAPSWHTPPPTRTDGDCVTPPGVPSPTSPLTPPRYLVHLSRRCPDCLIYLRAMEDALLTRFAGRDELIDCGWYTTTALGQLVHTADTRGGR
ncbi:hypothetical protein GCM10020256_11170 [Streptomyces thermocoprophilus]